MATTRETLFSTLDNSLKWSFNPVFARTNPIPLDGYSVFTSLTEAEAYAGGPIAYPGQVIAVVPDSGEAACYVIQTDGSLLKLISQNNVIPTLIGTKAYYEENKDKIPVGGLVIITDDEDDINDNTSSVLGVGVLGYMILG